MKTATAQSKFYLLFIIIILVWGLSWPINKIGLQYISPIWFAACRLLIGTISMFIVVLLLGKLVLPKREDLKLVFTIGLIQRGLFIMLICLGLEHVEAGRSAILVYTTPIWITPITIIFFGENSSFLKWLGLLLGVVGIVILFSPWEIDWTNNKELVGNGMLLLAAFCWAISILCARYMKWSRSPLELAPWQLLAGTLPVILIAFFKDPHIAINLNSTLISALLYTGILATAFAYWGTVVISKELPPIPVSIYLLAIPVCGLLFSAWILQEPITLSITIAIILITSGLLCLTMDKDKN